MKYFTLAWTVMFICHAAMAVPARPGYLTYTQNDGSQITVQLVGDEFFHYFITQDGVPVDCDEKGNFHYLTSTGVSTIVAHDQSERTAEEVAFITQQPTRQQAIETMRGKALRAVGHSRKIRESLLPAMGSPRVPILLVQYTDKQMSNTKEQFEAHYKTDSKSVLQYFTDQSNGKYTPQFDLYGIYTLPSTRATYGARGGFRNDIGVAQMVCDAIDTAGDEIDWSLYDNNGDGEADVCIVVYAGPGEAQGAAGSTVWPCRWDLATAQEFDDGDGPQVVNGVTINNFAVFNEIVGPSDLGTTMDGIGTFCHEFSHCLGLPDFYSTTYAFGCYGMGGWSLMATGCYNGEDVAGDTPIGYSAYEKNSMGWIDYVEPTPNTYYTLPVFNAKNIDTDKAIKITSDLNENEYFILENRRKQGWDQYIADEGVLITHFTYVPDRWEANTINNEVIQLATIIPADNTASNDTESNDLYGNSNHEFTPNSSPAMVLNMFYNDSLASLLGGAGALDKPVTEIVINNDLTASLWYNKGEVNVSSEQLSLRASIGKTKTAAFTVNGKGLPQDLKLMLNDQAGVFSLDRNSLTVDEVGQGVTVSVTFAPLEIANYTGTITLSCDGISPVTIELIGEGLIESETPVMQPADKAYITETSFRADWTDETPSENVKSYTLYVDAIVPQILEVADFSLLNEQVDTYVWGSTLRNVASEASNFLPQGWTCGDMLYVTDGAIIMASDINTNEYQLPEGYDNLSVVLSAKSFSSDQYGLSTIQLKTSNGCTSQLVNITDEVAEYSFLVDASASEALTFMVSNYPEVSNIRIYAGDINSETTAPQFSVIEQGNMLKRVVEGITDKYFVVENLQFGGRFKYSVEPIFINDTRGDMSNIQTVTLLQSVGMRGDINCDGHVDIADVNIIINIMLGKDNADNYDGRAYITEGDQVVDISDVNAVINLMLGN